MDDEDNLNDESILDNNEQKSLFSINDEQTLSDLK